MELISVVTIGDVLTSVRVELRYLDQSGRGPWQQVNQVYYRANLQTMPLMGYYKRTVRTGTITLYDLLQQAIVELDGSVFYKTGTRGYGKFLIRGYSIPKDTRVWWEIWGSNAG